MGNHLSSTHQTLLTSINIIIMILNSISALQINSTLDPSLIYTNNTPPSIIINPSNQTHPSNQTFNSTTPRSDLISCLKNIGDEILTPDSSPWSESIKTYNSRISPIPKLLISPRSIDSIIKTFDCARSFPGTRLSALGGGHSYTSLGMGGTNGAVVVEMKHFKELKLIKPDINHPLPSPLVRVGGGVLIRELINFLLKNGGLSFPHAKYTEVGVVGSAIGGGFGTASRLYGTTLDNVLAVEIVLPDGKLTRATPKENSEIFYAVLGAGSSYGIITTIELRTHPLFPNPVIYEYAWYTPSIYRSIKIFEAFQDFGLTQAPPELSMRLQMSLPRQLVINGVFYGDVSALSEILKPLISQLPAPGYQDFRTRTFEEVEAEVTGPLEKIPTPKQQKLIYLTSLVSFEPIPPSAIQDYFLDLMLRNDAMKAQNVAVSHFVDLWGGYHSYNSKMNHTQPYAFPHDQALLIFRSDGTIINTTHSEDWPSNTGAWSTDPKLWPSQATDFVHSFMTPLFESQAVHRCYPDFRDSAYDESQWTVRYHGDQYPALQKLKAKVDPNDIMSANPQSIRGRPDGVKRL